MKSYDWIIRSALYLACLLAMLFILAEQGSAQLANLNGPVPQFFSASGTPLAGGKLYSYQAGTSTPLATYSDAAGTILNANPITLDVAGFPVNGSGAPTAIFLKAQAYKLTLKDSLGVQIWSVDNLTTLAPLGMPFLAGTLANRPATCKASITFYVQTDSPYTLWQCNSTGTGWTAASLPGFGSVGQQLTMNPAGTAATWQDKPVVDVRDYAGASGSAQVANANAAAIARGVGVIDARGYGNSIVTIASTMTIGDLTHPIKLLVDHRTNWQTTITDASDGVHVCNGGGIIGDLAGAAVGNGSTSTNGFTLSNTAHVRSMITGCSVPQEFFTLDGLAISGNKTATVDNALVWADQIFVNSRLANLFIGVCPSVCLHLQGSTVVKVDNVWINALDGLASADMPNAQPLLIEADGILPPGPITFVGGALEHQASGKWLGVIQGNGAGVTALGIRFDGTYFENGTGGTGALRVIDCFDCTFDGNAFQGLAATTGIQFEQTAGGLAKGSTVQSFYNAVATHAINDTVYTGGQPITAAHVNYTQGGGVSLFGESLTTGALLTTSNCSSVAAPATCAAAVAGSVVIAAAGTTVTVNTTAVTANSQILLTRDNSLGTKLGVACNTQSSLVLGTPYVSARTANTSFAITIDAGPTTNPMCISYTITN